MYIYKHSSELSRPLFYDTTALIRVRIIACRPLSILGAIPSHPLPASCSPKKCLRIIRGFAVYCCCCIMVVWLCSWNLSPSLCCVARVFCTHRAMQPFSREERALEVKSSTQEVKQFSNMLWNIWHPC